MSDKTCGHTRSDHQISIFFYDGGTAAAVIALVLKKKRERSAEPKKRTKWMQQWLVQRIILGVYNALKAGQPFRPGSRRYYEEGYKYERDYTDIQYTLLRLQNSDARR